MCLFSFLLLYILWVLQSSLVWFSVFLCLPLFLRSLLFPKVNQSHKYTSSIPCFCAFSLHICRHQVLFNFARTIKYQRGTQNQEIIKSSHCKNEKDRRKKVKTSKTVCLKNVWPANEKNNKQSDKTCNIANDSMGKHIYFFVLFLLFRRNVFSIFNHKNTRKSRINL